MTDGLIGRCARITPEENVDDKGDKDNGKNSISVVSVVTLASYDHREFAPLLTGKLVRHFV